MATKAQADVTELQSDGASSIVQRYPENEAYMHTLKYISSPYPLQRFLLRYRATWCQQFGALLKRAALDTVREPLLLRVRTFQIIVRRESSFFSLHNHLLQLIAILTGLIYVNSPSSGAAYIMNTNGVLFQIVVNMTFSFVFAVVNVSGVKKVE